MEKSLLVQSRIWAGYVLISLIFVLLEAFSPVTAQSVTIATDQDDYFPGQWVIITGSGWQNNNSVQLSLTHVEPLPDPFHLHDPWFVKPDSTGDIYYEWFVAEQELGTSFELTALGIPTGESATTFFTDAIKSESYPQKFNQLTGANTYCQNTSPQDITVSWIFTTCTGNGTGSSNIPLTITWYSNTVNSNNGGISLGSKSLNQNTTSATYQPSTATVGTLYYYAVLSWGAGSYCVTAGSISSGTIGVNVTAPSVVPSVTISSTAQTICAGTQVTFTANPVNGGTNPSYQWKRNGSDIGNNNPTFTSSVLTEGDVITCALSSSAQCITQAVVYSNSITMKVNPKPTGVISGTQSICSGSRAELMINVTGNGPWSGTLSDGMSFNGSENPVKVYVSPDKNTTYSLVSLNDANCTSAQTDLSGSAKVTVLSSPTATIEINGTNPVCYNTASGIKFTGPPDGTVTYKMNDGDAITGSLNHGGNLTLETAPLTANTTFTLINVSNGSCSEPANGSVTLTLESTPPSWTTLAGSLNITLECSDAAGLANAQSKAPEAIDNCGGTLIPIKTAGSLVTGSGCRNTGTYTNSWIVYDAAGNKSSEFTQIITVLDETAPTFTMPGNITINKDKDGNFDSSVSKTGDVENEADNCSTGLQATFVDADPIPGSCEGSVIIKRTWSLVDNCGNHADEQVQTITVLDNTPPTFTKPEDKTVYKDASCDYDVSVSSTGDVTDERDNCSTGLEASFVDSDPVPGSCQGSVIIKRTWSLVDNCGNHADEQVQSITVLDNTPPTFTAPKNITIYKDASCGYDASLTGDVTDEADNCSTGLQATFVDADPLPGSCEGSVIIKRTWSLVDNCGNHADEQVQTITVLDNTPPTFTAPKNITIYKDASCGYDASVGATGDVTNEGDNCSKGIQATYVDTDVTPAGSCKGMEIIRRTWSLSDKCGNAAADQIQFITILDNLKPVFTSSVANGAIVDVAYDPSSCGVVYNYTISANDNCSGVVTPVLNKGLSSGSTFPKGSTVVTYSAKDECGNESEYSFTVRVNKAEAGSELTVNSLPVSTDPAEQQYSDQVKLTVVIKNGYSSCGADAATGVNFYIGTQLMNSSPVTFTQMGTGKDMKAELTVALLEPAASNGQMSPTAPGTRTVSAKLVSVNSELYNIADPTDKTLLIKPEDARTNFTGTNLVATSSATSGSATVTLRSTIQDISALMDPAADSYPGDIRNARVRFLSGSTAISGYLTPTLLNPGDLKTGVVSFTWTPNIGTATDVEFNIYTEVSGYYTNTSELTVVTVYKPTGDFITGGGYIIPQKTQGTYSSEKYTGLKTNFGFNVKYNKNGSNLQGNMNFIIRNWVNGVLHTYQVKANAMTSLGVDISKIAEQKAVFVSKANMTDITNPLMPVSLGGNLTLQISMTDKGEPGTNDLIGISLWNEGTLLFSNNWTGSITDQQLLGGGNLVVHSGYSLNPGLTAPSLVKAMALPEERNIGLRTYPNPFTDHLYFEIDFPSKGKACLELFDMSGAKIATLLNEEVDAQFYRLEYIPDVASGGIIVYRLSMNGIVLKTGKVIKK